MLAEDGEEVGGGGALVEEERAAGVVGEGELGAEGGELRLARAEVEAVPVEAGLAGGDDAVLREQRAQGGGVRRAAGDELRGARRVAARGGEEAARVRARERQRRAAESV